jgi:hypothetical protein
MRFRNFTPHPVVLNNGTEFPSEGVARVSSTHTAFDENGICSVQFGDVVGLPEQEEGTILIVSAIVAAAAAKAGRTDVVSPATGHPEAVREQGQIKSVPGFVRAQ